MVMAGEFTIAWQEQFPHLPHAPIVEAVIDIRARKPKARGRKRMSHHGLKKNCRIIRNHNHQVDHYQVVLTFVSPIFIVMLADDRGDGPRKSRLCAFMEEPPDAKIRNFR